LENNYLNQWHEFIFPFFCSLAQEEYTKEAKVQHQSRQLITEQGEIDL